MKVNVPCGPGRCARDVSRQSCRRRSPCLSSTSQSCCYFSSPHPTWALHMPRVSNQKRGHGHRITATTASTCMVLELLLHAAGGHVPDNRSLVDGAAEQQVALLVPLEREDGPAVPVQHGLQLACARPDACRAVVRARRKQRPVVLQRGHALLRDELGLYLRTFQSRVVTSWAFSSAEGVIIW